MHTILQFFHELKKERMRMFLTIVAVCWGSANVVLMLSVGEGMYRQLGAGMRGMGNQVVVNWPNQTSKPFAGFSSGRSIRLVEDDIEVIWKRVPEIDKISPEYMRWGMIIKAGKKTSTIATRGIYPCYGPIRNLFPQPGGRFINDTDQANKRRVIFLGNTIKKDLFSDSSEAVSKTVMLNGIPFTVIGVMKEKLQISCYNGNDEYQAFIPASTFQALLGQQHIETVIFTPRTARESKPAQDGLRHAMAAKYRFDPEDKETFSVWDAGESNNITDMITRGIQLFVGLIGGLTLLIAGIGVANIMYVAIKERTREIGIKMAVGARPRYIIGQFVAESLLTVGIGGLLGMALAFGLVEVIKMIPVQNEAMKFLGKPVFSAMLALICTVILGFIGLLAGIFPARRASNIDPVEALRYE